MWDRMEDFPIGFISLQRFIRDKKIVELRAGVGRGVSRRLRLTVVIYGSSRIAIFRQRTSKGP